MFKSVCLLRRALDRARSTSQPEQLLRAAVTVGCPQPHRGISGEAPVTEALPPDCLGACVSDEIVAGFEREGGLR
jgi:hypothetical protein